MTEETLGKRISTNRKRLGMTQDALAEQLGVTAQAVSKWENDQSCPDITMLPRLSRIFGIRVDTLLGMDSEAPRAELQKKIRERQDRGVFCDPRKRAGFGIALWLLTVGILMMLIEVYPGHLFHVPLWTVAGLSGLAIFGLFGIYPRFNLFRLGCGLWGGYCLYCQILHPAIYLNTRLWTAVLLVILGGSLLADVLRGRQVFAKDLTANAAGKTTFEYVGNSFLCSTCFGSDRRMISLPVLEGGEGNVIFGELFVDMQGCSSVSRDCSIVLRCLFGSLTIIVPQQIRLQCVNKTIFAVVRESGQPNPAAAQVVRLENNACFGQIQIKYI